MYTESVRFCTGPDVNFDFFLTSYHHWGIFDVGATAILCGNSMEIRISMGKKLALITSGAIRLPKTKPDSDPIKKRQSRLPDLHQIFPPPRGATRLFVIGPDFKQIIMINYNELYLETLFIRISTCCFSTVL